MKVLSTKSLYKSAIDHAMSLNMEIECLDFIEIQGTEFDMASVKPDFDSVAFTSANAVKYFLQNKKAVELIKDKNIFSLSGKTQEELLKHKLKPSLTEENATDLAEAIIQNKSSKSILHVGGNLALDALGKNLKNANIEYSPLTVYETVLQSNGVWDKGFEVIMFYSPSGIESFFAANEFKNTIPYCCIGNTTAAVLKEKHHNAKIILATSPSPESMIDAIHLFFKPKMQDHEQTAK